MTGITSPMPRTSISSVIKMKIRLAVRFRTLPLHITFFASWLSTLRTIKKAECAHAQELSVLFGIGFDPDSGRFGQLKLRQQEPEAPSGDYHLSLCRYLPVFSGSLAGEKLRVAVAAGRLRALVAAVLTARQQIEIARATRCWQETMMH